jgi:hypothetical protein
LSKISSDLVPTAIQLSKFAGHYLHIGEPKWFDWDSFLQAALRYSGNDLVVIPRDQLSGILEEGANADGKLIKGYSDKPVPGKANQPILSRDIPIPVSEMVDWIAWFITVVVGVDIDRNAIYATVENAFTNLKWASESGFADFSSSSTGTNSSWEYRITFASPYGGDKFLSFVSTLYLEADIRTESEWWGLVSSTTARFYCQIIGLKFQVTKGFTDPY